MSRDWKLYLADIVDAADKIFRFTQALSYDEFCQTESVFDAVLFNLQIIGEAVKQLPAHATAMMPEIAWTDAARFRDLVAHHYFSIDPEIVWNIVKQRIPDLRATARSVLDRLDSEQSP